MRELTEAEKVSLSKMRQDFIKAYGRDELDLVSSALLFAFIAGLASQDSRIAELEFLLRLDCVAPAIEGYKVGRQAALDNQYLTDCPYDAHTIERKAWMEGYNQVRFEQSKVR